MAFFRRLVASWFLLGLVLSAAEVAAQERRPTRDDALQLLRPYDGPAAKGVDATTLDGKVMAGYQGWFTVPGDGSGTGYRHYSKGGEFRPGRCNIDLWPDVSDLTAAEKFATPFKFADGATASVFSSHNRTTVLRHFQWMKEYGIDGVFLQRFGAELGGPTSLNHCNTVLVNCRAGANEQGRCYAVMYDLSGLPAGGTERIRDDWKTLVDRFKLGHDSADKAYLRHHGQPVVTLWGIGFNDNRKYTLEECEQLVTFLKDDEKYGGNTVMLGVPTGWRTRDRDCVKDEALQRIILKGDIVSPWTVGRYGTLDGVERHATKDWKNDVAWCREHRKDYLPVVFPGFSWHNMRPEAKFNQIPRLKGDFLWRQYVAAKEAGATMIYQAMFDEMDEGTAIFKCLDQPPVGDSSFVTMDGLRSDHYLWLVGQGKRLLTGEIPVTKSQPARER